MKLYYAPQSPFARKARVACIELGFARTVVCEYVKVIPGSPNPDYAESVNPLKKIPALVADTGEVIYDSTVICEYLDDLAGGDILIPRDPVRRWQVLTNHSLAHGMCESIISIRYETALRLESHRWQGWIDDHWDKVHAGMRWFERHGGALEGKIDLAKITLACALGYIDFRWPQRNLRKEFPAIDAWFGQIKLRRSFADTKPRDPE